MLCCIDSEILMLVVLCYYSCSVNRLLMLEELKDCQLHKLVSLDGLYCSTFD